MSIWGSAVVDRYVIIRQSDVYLFSDLQVITMSEASDVVKHFISDSCRIPDHSLIVCEISFLTIFEIKTLQ